MTTLRDRIEDGRVHLFDGAMGTLLYARGVFVNVCYDELALERPELVLGIHREYVAAGADILETNTFGANPVKLSGHGLADSTEEINRAAAVLAREAAEDAEREGRGRPEPVHVVGAIGPLGIRIEPWGPTSGEEATTHFRRQVAGLLEGGVDGFCLETFGDLNELEAAYRAVRALSDLPVFGQVTIREDLATAYGTDVAHAAAALTELGLDAIGLNCSVGPATILEGVEEMAAHTDRPLSAQPNAGMPRTVRDRKMYMASPEYMAQYARRLIEAGARFVGGCCGTTPEHIARMDEVVRSLQPRHTTIRVVEPVTEVAAAPPLPLAERSALGAKLAAGDFVESIEVVPPRGWDTTTLLDQARRAGEAGVDLISLVDSPRGGRMGAIAAGLAVLRAETEGRRDQGGRDGGNAPSDGDRWPEPVVHYTCRDRNMMGMVADLLGAAAGGLRDLLLVSGDPTVQGPYPDSTAVFDIDAIGLTNVVDGLNRGLDPGGAAIGEPTRFVVGVAANPGALDLDREVDRFHWKVEAGADFAVTQLVFDVEALERFLDRTAEWPIPIVAGVWPLTSIRNADYLAHEVPGVTVPDRVLERMRAAHGRGPEHAAAEGVEIALEVVEAVRRTSRIRGVALTAPGGDLAGPLAVLRGMRSDLT